MELQQAPPSGTILPAVRLPSLQQRISAELMFICPSETSRRAFCVFEVMGMLSELQAKAGSFANFLAMGWPQEKAMAHADVSEAELPKVLEEVERQSVSPEERAAKKLDARFKALEEATAANSDRLMILNAEVQSLKKALAATRSTSSQTKQRKKPQLSDEERQRRSERAKANFAKRHEQQRSQSDNEALSKSADDNWTPVTS